MENTSFDRDDRGSSPAQQAAGPPIAPVAAAPAADEMPRRGRRGRYSRSQELPYKSPALGSFFSLVPGLGQVYVGYYQRGFVNAAVVTALITALVIIEGPLDVLLGVFLAFYWLYNMIDAGRCATLYNQALEGANGTVLPENFAMPGSGGSLFGGVALIVFGVLILMHTKFDFSLSWLEEWWPLGAIGFGVYLVYKSRQGQKS